MDGSEEAPSKILEILVALDHSSQSRAALSSAVSIAKILEGKIHGLFVHDAQWLRISKLSSLSVVDELTGRISSEDSEDVKKKILELEKTIKEHFELISRQHELAYSWSSVKGVVADKILEKAEQSDIITIGSKGRSYSNKDKLGSTALEVIRRADKPVLILQKQQYLAYPPAAVFDGSERSVAGVEMASRIAKQNETRLVIIDLSNAFTSDEALERMPKRYETESKVLKLDQPNIGKFLFMISNLRSGLLILPKNDHFTSRRTMEYILQSSDCPVLLTA